MSTPTCAEVLTTDRPRVTRFGVQLVTPPWAAAEDLHASEKTRTIGTFARANGRRKVDGLRGAEHYAGRYPANHPRLVRPAGAPVAVCVFFEASGPTSPPLAVRAKVVPPPSSRQGILRKSRHNVPFPPIHRRSVRRTRYITPTTPYESSSSVPPAATTRVGQ